MYNHNKVLSALPEWLSTTSDIGAFAKRSEDNSGSSALFAKPKRSEDDMAIIPGR